MFRNVLLKSLYDQRRGLAGWSAGAAILVVLMAAVFPSIRDMPDFQQLLQGYPEAFRKLFDIEAMTTGAGYLNAELFSIMLPALFIVFAVGRGARAIAGEEEAGTLEVLLVTPLSPARLLLQQAAALAISLSALGVVLLVSVLASSAMFDMGVQPGAAVTGTLSMVLIGLEHGWLALAVGAVTGRRSAAIAVAAVVAFAGYVLYIAGELVEAVQPWQPISPFSQALTGGPLGAGLPMAYLWMPVAAIVFVALAVPLFDRRDPRA